MSPNGKAPAAWRLLDVEVAPEGATFGYALNRKKLRKVWRREGRYLLRTNLSGRDPAELWQFYIQLVEVEAAFKNLKDDLQLRPDLPSTDRSHRGAHLRRVPGLLPARHPAGAAAAARERSHSSRRTQGARDQGLPREAVNAEARDLYTGSFSSPGMSTPMRRMRSRLPGRRERPRGPRL